MNRQKKVPIEILEHSKETIKVKLPFLDVPVEMNQNFFKSRLEQGYFVIGQQNDTES